MKWLVGLLLAASAFAIEQEPFQYTGFRQGEMGVGAVLGLPAGVRLQRFLSWRAAVFITAGYSIDQYLTADANYSYYLLAQEDPWRDEGKVGYILYNVFGGVTAGLPLRDGDTARMGIRAGGAFEYLLPNSTWTLRAEIAPVVYLSGQYAAGFQSGVLAMYYFGDLGRAVKNTHPKGHP